MLVNKILKNLENGNYRIAYSEQCDCEFYWRVENGEFLCDTVYNGGCYHENLLIMDDMAGEFDEIVGVGYKGVIASFDSYYGVSLQILCSEPDIAKKIQRYIINDAEIFRDFIASLNYPDKRNELHEKRKYKALGKFSFWKEIKMKRKRILSIMWDELLEKVIVIKDFLLKEFNEVEKEEEEDLMEYIIALSYIEDILNYKDGEKKWKILLCMIY